MRLQCRKSAFLVGARQSAIAGHVSGQNGFEPSRYPLLVHGSPRCAASQRPWRQSYHIWGIAARFADRPYANRTAAKRPSPLETPKPKCAIMSHRVLRIGQPLIARSRD